MCLILFAYNAHPNYRLILAANRDEFYARPTETAAFWADAPQILAGRDAVHGGTWLGITKTGRFAAVTNYRDPSAPTGTKSRGDLTGDFLLGEDTAENYLQNIERENYSGFNLLAGDFAGAENELCYLSSRAEKSEKLAAGIYGLSNALLDTNWHKVETGKARFTEILQKTDKINAENLFEILADTTRALCENLPETGVGIERERILSPAFIETEIYGTRSTTILLIETSGQINFIEKTYIGETGTAAYEFFIN